MKKITTLALFLILVSSCYALVIQNPQPTITTIFNEPILVQSIDAELEYSNNDLIDLILIHTSPDNTTFKHKPINFLSEGNYIFSIQASDIHGNPGNLKTQQFTIQVPPLSIELIEPRFGWSPTEIFNIIIESSLPSDCRYSLVPKNYEDMSSFFTTEDNLTHTLSNFDGTITNLLYIACKTSYNNETTVQDFNFHIDTSPPEIVSINAEDITELPILTTLQVTTNERTVCTYSKTQTSFEDSTPFTGENQTREEDYQLSHSQTLTDQQLIDFQTNSFYIICKNRARLDSATSQIGIDVQSESEAEVTINHPQSNSYLSSASIRFNISTNKVAKCHFSNNTNEISGSGGAFGTFTKEHVSSPVLLSPNTHTYYFQCLVNTPEGLLNPASTTFTIDTSPPNLLYVNDSNNLQGMENLSQFTYYRTKLFVKWHAEDNESGIKEYNYSIFKDNSREYNQDEIIQNWTIIQDQESGPEDITVEDLNLTDKGTYYFKFKAKNKAGIWSPEKTSDGITVDLALLLIGNCNNGVKDIGFNETDIDCGGSCSPCGYNKTCRNNTDCLSNYCNSSNKCDTTSTGPSCFDNTRNQNETDIDCGGNCQGCSNGKACINNTDCTSGHCDPDTQLCIFYDTCSNSVKDGEETDLDCGGNCPPCEIGNQCILDSDCLSDYCSIKTNTCQEFTTCGDGIIDVGEQCENSTDGKTCTLFGFNGGVLTCGENCIFDTTNCTGPTGVCNDSTINPGEQCEDENWGNVKGCFDFDKFESGKLSCQNCTLNTAQCSKKIDPSQDTDNDGMPDVCEQKWFNCRTCAEPNEDPDEDGLTNKKECTLCTSGTNPKSADTDGDKHKDGKEVEKGTDPCDKLDYPKSKLMPFLIFLFILFAMVGGGGYYLYIRKIITFTDKPPYIIINAPAQTPSQAPQAKPLISFLKQPPYIQLNAKIEILTKPPFISIEREMLPQQTQTQTQTQIKPQQRAPQQILVRPRVRPRRKPVSIGRLIKTRKRKKLFESFGETEEKEKPTQESKTEPPKTTITKQEKPSALDNLPTKQKEQPTQKSKKEPSKQKKPKQSEKFKKLAGILEKEDPLNKLPIPKSKKKKK